MNPQEPQEKGTVFETHPGVRSPMAAYCYARGHHVADFSEAMLHGACKNCGSVAGLPFHDAAKEPTARKVSTFVPDKLTHNPDATFEELMAVRENPEKFKADAEPVAAAEPISITRDQVKQLAEFYGLYLVDPEGISGATAHASEQIKTLQEQNAALLKRAQDAEAKVPPPETAPKEAA